MNLQRGLLCIRPDIWGTVSDMIRQEEEIVIQVFYLELFNVVQLAF